MGREYVIDHCSSQLKKETKEKVYQEYVSECMRFISHNTAILASVLTNGNADVSYIGKPFREILRMSEKPVDNRTSTEIINDFLDHFGGKEEAK